MKYEVTINGEAHEVTVEALGEETADGLRRYRLTVGDQPPVEVERARPVPDVVSMLIDGRSWEAGLVGFDGGFVVELLGVQHEVAVIDPRKKALRLASGASGGAVVTQMPGRVVAVLVAPGQSVSKGEPVVIVEAMKMENQLKAPVAGVVKAVKVEAGALVEARSTLLEITPG
ncbi:MAG: biotin/lipoyl-containing protein [Myxococcota bacterium]